MSTDTIGIIIIFIIMNTIYTSAQIFCFFFVLSPRTNKQGSEISQEESNPVSKAEWYTGSKCGYKYGKKKIIISQKRPI